MENKINIAELLKDCKKGMELYSPLFGDCKFIKVHDYEAEIIVELETGATVSFLTDGRYYDYPNAECILFPKGKTTWEGFVSPCKFKVGDRITDKNKFIYRITEITDKGYKLHDLKTTFITFEEADLYFVKVVDVFDITTLKPFEKVLVRGSDNGMWCASIFSHTWKDKYFCVGTWHNQCIPYEANKELLGTTNDCDEYYKTWE